jgi:hypothetical protein
VTEEREVTLEEIKARLVVGRSKAVVVDISLVPEVPGFVRTVIIRPQYEVEVEFNSYGLNEGGACFVGEFDTLQNAVASVEEYLGVPYSEWVAEHEYPRESPSIKPSDAENLLALAIATRRIRLPRGEFQLRDSYWSRFLPQSRPMQFVEAPREEVEEAEHKIDAALEVTPLPSSSLNASQYHVVTASEDLLRIALLESVDLGGEALLAAIGMLDSQKYALKRALSTVARRQSGTEPANIKFDIDAARRASELLGLAEKHETAVVVFSSYHAGLARCNIRRLPLALQFLPQRDSDRFNVLDILEGESYRGEAPFTPMLRWFKGPQEWPDCVMDIVGRVTRASATSVEYEYSEVLGKRLYGELPLRLILFPGKWSSTLGSADEVARVLHALQTVCAYHIISVTLGARLLGVDSLSNENVALLLSKETLRYRVASLSSCAPEQVARLLEVMTYGKGVDRPDPSLQPLIELGAGQLLLPPLTILSSHVQRNFLVLLARADKKSFDSASHFFEESMIEGISGILSRKGWTFKTQFHLPGARDAGEVDLVIVDPQSRMILTCELKWTIPVAETREVINREKMAVEKVEQLKKKIEATKKNLHHLLQSLGISTAAHEVGAWKVEGVVVVEGFAAQANAETPVVTRPTFEWGVAHKKTLKSVFYWLKSKKWLPVRDIHFRRVTREDTINGVQILWPGLMPTPKGLRFVWERA